MSGNRIRILTIIYPFLIMALFMGCRDPYQSKAEIEKEIKALLFLREEAIGNKDIERYMECISRNYSDKNDTYTSIREKMQKKFQAFDKIDLSQFHQTIYQEDDMIMIVQDYELSFSIGGKQDFVRGKEKIYLERTGREWKIVKGL